MESISLATLIIVLSITLGSCFTVIPTSTTAFENDSTTFICSISGTCPMVTWTGPALTEGSTRIVISGPSDYKLEIRDLRSEDTGEYSCSCNGGDEGTGYLQIRRLPTAAPNSTQTIQEGNQANIVCPGDPGDPPRPVDWQFNFNSLSPRYVPVPDSLRLRIATVSMEDAGIYTCIFDGPRGHVLTNITVTVERRNVEIRFVQPTRREIVLGYTDPLNLTCEVESSTEVNVSWIVLSSATQTSTLALAPGEVRTGLYECIAYNSRVSGSYQVYVTVNAKPIFPETRIDKAVIVKASEGSVLEHREITENRAPSYGGTTVIQWRRKESGEIVDFGSRLQVYWTENHLTWSIKPASLEDNGQYWMNVSNEFGGTNLLTTLRVSMVQKRTVSVKISDQSCKLLMDHKVNLGIAIASKYSICQTTCEVSLLETVMVNCVDDSSAIVSLQIPADYFDPSVRTITFSFGTGPFTGTVIKTPPTTLVETRPTNAPHTGSTNGILTPVVVVVAFVSIVIVLALILTVVFRNKLKCKRKEAVNPEDPRIEDKEDVICTAYVAVRQKEDVPVVPSSPITPVGITITPVYIPPSPTPEKGKTPPPQETARPAADRPKKLYFRSHSYSYSGRTPPDHRSRQH